MWQHDATLLGFLPPQSQQREQLGRQHGVAVLASLALFDPDQHARAVDIIDLEAGHFRHAQARAIGGAKYGLVFDARCRLEQPADFLHTQHRWQLAWIARQDQASRQIRTVERYGEEEAQRRDGTVDGGWLYPTLALVNLKPPNILSRCRIGGCPRKAAKLRTKRIYSCCVSDRRPRIPMSSIMRCRSALTGRSIVGTGIGSSSHDEGNSMLERQPRPAQGFIENAHSIEVQGIGPWRGLGQRPKLTCFCGQWFSCRNSPALPIPRSGFVHGRVVAEESLLWSFNRSEPARPAVLRCRTRPKLAEPS